MRTLTQELLAERIEEHGLKGMLTSFWNIFPEPNDTHEYELWEEALHEMTLWIQQTYFHRFTPDDLEDALTVYLNSIT